MPPPLAPPPGLASLLAPLDRDRFLADCWPGQCHAIHGEPGRLGGLFAIPELADLGSLLRAWQGDVMVNLPDRHEEHSHVQVGASVARKLYDNGMVLTFGRVEKQIPYLRTWLARLQADLGLPRSALAFCLVYANPTGETVSPHFDANANFIVQLRGTKGWRYAPNTWIANPTERHAMNKRRPYATLRRQTTSPAPTRMPARATRTELRPGSVLFLARGWWHETVAREEALSLNFVFQQPTWADVVGSAIVQRLHRHPHWRALADGVGLSGDRRGPAARAELARMLHRLADDLGPLDAAAIIETTEGGLHYEWNPAATFELDGDQVTLQSASGEDFAVEGDDEELVPLLLWLTSQSQPFARIAFEDRFPDQAGSPLFEDLVAGGLVRVATAS